MSVLVFDSKDLLHCCKCGSDELELNGTITGGDNSLYGYTCRVCNENYLSRGYREEAKQRTSLDIEGISLRVDPKRRMAEISCEDLRKLISRSLECFRRMDIYETLNAVDLKCRRSQLLVSLFLSRF